MRHQIALAVALLGLFRLEGLFAQKEGRPAAGGAAEEKGKERRVTAHPGGPASGVSVCPFLDRGDGR